MSLSKAPFSILDQKTVLRNIVTTETSVVCRLGGEIYDDGLPLGLCQISCRALQV